MKKSEYQVFNSNDWEGCLNLLEKYWNTDYGTMEICKEKNGRQTLELTTGGWSENESFINKIADTIFWILWWQESKRGGYFKFVYPMIEVEGRMNND